MKKINPQNLDNPVTMSSRIYRDPEIVTAALEDELVMFSLEKGMYYGLDDIASQIWQRMAESISVSDLCEGLLDDFEVDRETCRVETLELLNWLYQQELIRIDPSGA